MHLLWKLLRRHLSPGQLAGFALANFLGMMIVLLSVQFYVDLAPAFAGDDMDRGFVYKRYCHNSLLPIRKNGWAFNKPTRIG